MSDLDEDRAGLYDARTGMRWYAARVHWGREKAIAERIQNKLGFSTYAPMMEMDGKEVSAAFPSYLFCSFNMDQDGWQRINEDRGVVKLLPLHSIYPVDIPDQFMTWVRDLDQRGEFKVRTAKGRLLLKYGLGDVVPIRSGTFSGLHATFEEQIRDNVYVLLSIFGRASRTMIPLEHIGA